LLRELAVGVAARRVAGADDRVADFRESVDFSNDLAMCSARA
jgi:hypothetical protein